MHNKTIQIQKSTKRGGSGKMVCTCLFQPINHYMLFVHNSSIEHFFFSDECPFTLEDMSLKLVVKCERPMPPSVSFSLTNILSIFVQINVLSIASVIVT